MRIRYYSMASAAEMCTIQVQEKSGILKKTQRILKNNKALLLVRTQAGGVVLHAHLLLNRVSGAYKLENGNQI
jgi:hypothetical protein